MNPIEPVPPTKDEIEVLHFFDPRRVSRAIKTAGYSVEEEIQGLVAIVRGSQEEETRMRAMKQLRMIARETLDANSIHIEQISTDGTGTQKVSGRIPTVLSNSHQDYQNAKSLAEQEQFHFAASFQKSDEREALPPAPAAQRSNPGVPERRSTDGGPVGGPDALRPGSPGAGEPRGGTVEPGSDNPE